MLCSKSLLDLASLPDIESLFEAGFLQENYCFSVYWRHLPLDPNATSHDLDAIFERTVYMYMLLPSSVVKSINSFEESGIWKDSRTPVPLKS